MSRKSKRRRDTAKPKDADARQEADAPLDADASSQAESPAESAVYVDAATSTEPAPVSTSMPGRGFRAVVVTLAISVLAFFTGLTIFNFVVMPQWVHQGDETLVPDVRRLDVRQAEGVLDQAGLRLSIRGEQFDPEVPKGAVITQSPRPNDAVRRGRVITVFVSLGEEYASVPALHGESIRHARILLSRAGLEVGDVVRSHSEWLSQGLVLASDPPAQAVVPRGTRVHIVESQGPATEAYLMPDVRGLDARTMAQNLEALGFRVRVEGSIGGFATIFEQVPMPGVRIESSDEIVLRVAGRVIP